MKPKHIGISCLLLTCIYQLSLGKYIDKNIGASFVAPTQWRLFKRALPPNEDQNGPVAAHNSNVTNRVRSGRRQAYFGSGSDQNGSPNPFNSNPFYLQQPTPYMANPFGLGTFQSQPSPFGSMTQSFYGQRPVQFAMPSYMPPQQSGYPNYFMAGPGSMYPTSDQTQQQFRGGPLPPISFGPPPPLISGIPASLQPNRPSTFYQGSNSGLPSPSTFTSPRSPLSRLESDEWDYSYDSNNRFRPASPPSQSLFGQSGSGMSRNNFQSAPPSGFPWNQRNNGGSNYMAPSNQGPTNFYGGGSGSNGNSFLTSIRRLMNVRPSGTISNQLANETSISSYPGAALSSQINRLAMDPFAFQQQQQQQLFNGFNPNSAPLWAQRPGMSFGMGAGNMWPPINQFQPRPGGFNNPFSQNYLYNSAPAWGCSLLKVSTILTLTAMYYLNIGAGFA